MNGKQLKNSILQWAIQGKLVPQDPNDEPASVLLERIRAEKARLVKEGKIKKDKNESIIYKGDDNSYYEKFPDGKVVCIDEEIPFEIPKGWEWCRLKHVAEIARGGSPRPIKDFITESSDGINWIKIGDSEKGGKYINCTKEKIKPSGVKHSRMVHKGDFLLTNSMSFGRPYILNTDGCIHDGWLVISPCSHSYYTDYLYYLLSSPFAYDQFSGKVSGAVVQNLNSDKVASSLFPIPPFAEQKRIAEKLETLSPIIEQYTCIEERKSSLSKSIYGKLKKSILQEAIQGKLVPQVPSDEPAQTLLERIATEKQRLIKEGKLKAKDAFASTIFKGDDNKYYEKTGKDVVDITEEIPFEIPSNWCWTRASSIAQIIMGQSPDGESINSSNGIEFHQGKVHFTDKYLAVAPYFTSAPSKYAEPLSLLLCVRAPVGVANITERRICIGRGLCALNFYKGINLDLMFYFFATFKKYYEDLATGSTFKAISKDIVSDTLIPIPPEQEQIRIIEMIQSLYSKIA